MNEENTPWEYRPGGGSMASDVPEPEEINQNIKDDTKPVSWSASEYIDHENGLSWYLLLAAGTLTLGLSIFFLTKDYLATVTILILGVIVGAAAGRKPEQVAYELSERGIKIGDKFHSFRSYRSFYIVEEGELHSISLMPLKKFSPALSIYFDPADEERILKKLSQSLPFEEHKMDSVEKLSRKLKF